MTDITPQLISREDLLAALDDANSLCRSAYQIASRGGAETNWEAFRNRLADSLKFVQHPLLHPAVTRDPEDVETPNSPDDPTTVTARTFRAVPDEVETPALVHATEHGWALRLPREAEGYAGRIDIHTEAYELSSRKLTLDFTIPADPMYHPFTFAAHAGAGTPADPYPVAIDAIGPDGGLISRMVVFCSGLEDFSTQGSSVATDDYGSPIPQRARVVLTVAGVSFDARPTPGIDVARYWKART